MFVEVKTARGTARPEQRVEQAKRRRLTRVARKYLQHCVADEAVCRFDVLAISLLSERVDVEHLPDAFRLLD